MLTVIRCPACGRQLHLPDEMLGQPVQCAGCGGSFAAHAHAPPLQAFVVEEAGGPLIQGLPPVPRPLAPVLLSSTAETPNVPTAFGLARCPRCAARYTAVDERCRACGAQLAEERDDRPWENPGAPLRRDCEPHRAALLLTLGRLSLALAVPGLLGVSYLPLALSGLLAMGTGLAVSLMANTDLELMQRKEMDPDGERNTRTGQMCGNVALVLGLIGFGLVFLFQLPQLLGGLP